MKHMKKAAVGVFLLGQALSGAALAASVTLTGDTVDYTFDDALLGLFGTPTLVGDTLSFTPVEFQAESLNGAGIDLTNNTINVQVTAHSGYTFSSIDMIERGDYMLLGGGSSADVAGQIRVFDVANPLSDVTTAISPDSPLNQSGGGNTVNWSASNSTDISSWTDAQTVNVTWQNLLIGETNASSSMAFVDKKYGGLTAATVAAPIPEAEVSAMMLAGLGLVGWQISRRRSLATKA